MAWDKVLSPSDNDFLQCDYATFAAVLITVQAYVTSFTCATR